MQSGFMRSDLCWMQQAPAALVWGGHAASICCLSLQVRHSVFSFPSTSLQVIKLNQLQKRTCNSLYPRHASAPHDVVGLLGMGSQLKAAVAQRTFQQGCLYLMTPKTMIRRLQTA